MNFIFYNYRYLAPSEHDMRTAAGITTSSSKKSRKNDFKKPHEPMTIPKNTPLALDTSPVRAIDVMPLYFYVEYQWLLDFSLCNVFVYGLTEAYYAFFQPSSEMNLSMLWCLITVIFCIKVLFSLTAMYFRTEESGERILCVLFLFFFLILAMAVSLVDEDTLEFRLVDGYRSFSSEAQKFLKSQGTESAGPVSLNTYKIIVVIFSAILGSFLTFPGLRLAKMHTDALKYAAGRPFFQLMLYFNMIFPLFVSLLWVKPVARQYLVDRSYSGVQLLTLDQFEALRIVCVVAFCFYRFILCWSHFQAHLNSAYDKIVSLRKEVGKISSTEIQKTVLSVFYYLCIVALQYFAPLLLLLSFALMLKTLGEYSMFEPFNLKLPQFNFTAPVTSEFVADTPVGDFAAAFSGLKNIFTALYFRGLLSYLCWWVVSSWFVTTTFGLLYYSYLTVA